ncbi:MAG: hypothetical protein M1835_000270 [Candelina submexicana]|nr:MAG: hypothetical protein M1835_000270 [Candelina submexicana]
MQCDICSRPQGLQLPFHCTTCARSALYGLRVELGQTLLDNSSFVRRINPIIATGTGSAPSTNQNNGRLALEEASAKAERSAERTREISGHLQALRKEIEDGKADIAKRKAALAQRRSDASSATHNLGARRAATLDTVEKGTKKLEYRWSSLHAKTVESRVFLCREAANLYRLRQRRRKKGASIKEDYTIGGVSIVDLRDLNNASPAQITASLTNLAYLLLLTSHYLLLRLPAEITLPRKDYPLPTIFSPASSYLSNEVPFPGTSLSNSSNDSPSTSRTGDLRSQARPRPLYIDKPLPVLVKDDPATYALFIEGVTFLAWDVAWVCRTQGLNIGANSWEEVCALGKNLWQLFIAPSPQAPLSRIPPSRETPTTPSVIKSPRSASPTTKPVGHPVTLGYYSHGTAHSFLNSAEGTDYMRGWKLSSPHKIIDKLKASLSSEMGVAEWEYLDEKEWDEGAAINAKDEDAVLVGGARRRAKDGGDERSSMTSRMTLGDEQNVSRNMPRDGDDAKGKGTSGWTKLKSR